MSKARQLPMTGSLGAPWKATNDTWQRLEAAYGKTFDAELKVKIEKAIQKYRDWVGAPRASDFKEKLVKAHKLALELRKVVASFGEQSDLLAPHWENRFPPEGKRPTYDPQGDNIEDIWDWVMKQPHRPGYHRSFSETVPLIYYTLDDTLREHFNDDDDRRKQTQIRTWKELIANLASAFGNVSASKDTTRPLTPFVKFVKELQETFPRDFWRPASDTALSEAILEIIKNKRKT